jgi:hypothetical protein
MVVIVGVITFVGLTVTLLQPTIVTPTGNTQITIPTVTFTLHKTTTTPDTSSRALWEGQYNITVTEKAAGGGSVADYEDLGTVQMFIYPGLVVNGTGSGHMVVNIRGDCSAHGDVFYTFDVSGFYEPRSGNVTLDSAIQSSPPFYPVTQYCPDPETVEHANGAPFFPTPFHFRLEDGALSQGTSTYTSPTVDQTYIWRVGVKQSACVGNLCK